MFSNVLRDAELVDFARLTLSRRITVRFIEYMPLGDAALMHAPEGQGASGEGRAIDESVRFNCQLRMVNGWDI